MMCKQDDRVKRLISMFGFACLAWASGPDLDRANKLYNITEFQQSLEVLQAVPNKDAAVYEAPHAPDFVEGVLDGFEEEQDNHDEHEASDDAHRVRPGALYEAVDQRDELRIDRHRAAIVRVLILVKLRRDERNHAVQRIGCQVGIPFAEDGGGDQHGDRDQRPEAEHGAEAQVRGPAERLCLEE